MLDTAEAALLLVDIQGKLARMMHQSERLFQNLQILIQGARLQELPIVWAEHVPDKLGRTIDEVRNLLPDHEPLPKNRFSCARDEAILNRLNQLGRRAVVVAGIEAHICVYQTVLDLIALGFHVEVVSDAVSSRTPENLKIGLERMGAAGAHITSVEMVLFELQKVAEGERFRALAKLVK